MIAKAISFTPEVLKAKLRALEEYGIVQTRRQIRGTVAQNQWPAADRGDGRIWVDPAHKYGWVKPPFGIAGQPLWVRERARVLAYDGLGRGRVRLRYEVDGAESDCIEVPERIVTCEPGRCIANGVFREGARHFLEVVEVRTERVADISEQDALLEGIDRKSGEWAIASYFALYDSIYGAGAHARDWCWVYTLKRATP